MRASIRLCNMIEKSNISKILFLDFDGVCHSISSGGKFFDPGMTCQLANAIEPHNVSIVVSSSWRLDKPLDELRDLVGKQLGPRIIGVNPYIEEPFLFHCRYRECLLFLQEENLGGIPWVAVDDEAGHYPREAPVVICDSRKGFGPAEAEALDKLLRSL